MAKKETTTDKQTLKRTNRQTDRRQRDRQSKPYTLHYNKLRTWTHRDGKYVKKIEALQIKRGQTDRSTYHSDNRSSRHKLAQTSIKWLGAEMLVLLLVMIFSLLFKTKQNDT